MIEKVSIEIKGTPLIKFQSASRIEALRKGYLYAKTLEYYRHLEQETGDSDIGDEFEAMIHIHKGSFTFPDTGEVINLDDTLIPTSSSDDFVFCMFGIYPQLEKFQFSDEQKEKMLSFGDTALIILDSDDFIKRVTKAANEKGYDVHFGAVNYYNPDEDNGNFLISLLRGMWNVALWKRKKYMYQQEGRFVISSVGDKADHIELDIGDISDITAVVSAKQALTALVKKHE